MKQPGRYFQAGLLLVAAAAVLIAIALLTSRGDITGAAVVIAGMACAMAGIFMLSFSGGEPADLELVGLLPAGELLNICRVQSDLGITGTAHFLPPGITGEDGVMLFNPAGSWTGERVPAADSFPLTGPTGMVTLPSCAPLLREHPVAEPGSRDREEVTRLLRESVTGLFELAAGLSADWQDKSVTITLQGYRFTSGCRVIALESPQCCRMHPCPACSLCGTLLARGLDTVVALERCSPGPSAEEVTAVFSLLPVPDRNPEVEIPVAPPDAV